METRDRVSELLLKTLHKDNKYVFAAMILKSVKRDNMKTIAIREIRSSSHIFQHRLFFVVHI